MRRPLLNLLTLLSLLLCVAVCVLWVRSAYSADGGRWTRSDRWTWFVWSHRGTLSITAGSDKDDRFRSYRRVGFRFETIEAENLITEHDPDYRWRAHTYRRLAGFGYCDGCRQDFQWYEVFAPHWFLACVAGMPAAWQLLAVTRRRSRTRRSLCLRCGYDLRATPERCPECGSKSPA